MKAAVQMKLNLSIHGITCKFLCLWIANNWADCYNFQHVSETSWYKVCSPRCSSRWNKRKVKWNGGRWGLLPSWWVRHAPEKEECAWQVCVCVSAYVCACVRARMRACVYMVEVMMLKCVRAVCFLFVQLGLRDLDLLFIALHNATMLPSSVPT